MGEGVKTAKLHVQTTERTKRVGMILWIPPHGRSQICMEEVWVGSLDMSKDSK